MYPPLKHFCKCVCAVKLRQYTFHYEQRGILLGSNVQKHTSWKNIQKYANYSDRLELLSSKANGQVFMGKRVVYDVSQHGLRRRPHKQMTVLL